MVHPIIDENYSYNPYHCRSSQYARAKGLVASEKAANTASASSTPRSTPTPTPDIAASSKPKIPDRLSFRSAPRVRESVA
jgi:glutamine amidotransferase